MKGQGNLRLKGARGKRDTKQKEGGKRHRLKALTSSHSLVGEFLQKMFTRGIMMFHSTLVMNRYKGHLALARSCLSTIFIFTSTLVLGEGSGEGHSQGEELGQSSGYRVRTCRMLLLSEVPQPLHGSWCLSPSGPALAHGTDCHRTKSLLLLPRYFCLSRSKAHWRLGSLAVHQTPSLQVGHKVPAVLGTGNLPGTEVCARLISLAQTTSSIPCSIIQIGKRSVEGHLHKWSSNRQLKQSFSLFCSKWWMPWVFWHHDFLQAAIWTTWLGNGLLQPCTYQGENCN